MAALKIADIAVEGVSYHFDKPYSYLVPEKYRSVAVPGARVAVHFGGGNRCCQGIIISTEDIEADENRKKRFKALLSVLDDSPLLDRAMISLALWIKEQTFCALYEALRPMLPAGLNLKVDKLIELAPDFSYENFLLDNDEKAIVEALKNQKKPILKQKFIKKLKNESAYGSIESLVKKHAVVETEALKADKTEATISMVKLSLSENDAMALFDLKGALTPKQKNVVKTLIETGSAALKEVEYYAGVTAVVIKALIKKGILEEFEKRIYRTPYTDYKKNSSGEIILSECQQKAYNELLIKYQSGSGAVLLYGVTGSGKTSVFMKLIEKVKGDGRGVIVLVPEISLTPQAVARFYSQFGDGVAVLHSGLTVGERLDEWNRIKRGQAPIVVGTRSAIFAPVKNLGAVIIDEEQEHTYKSESSPRFHARDIARFRCVQNNALMVLASATPSIESYYFAKKGRYSLSVLNERYGNAVLPEVITVDMKEELIKGNSGPVSERLEKELSFNLSKGQQAILLLNRRGYNTFISCIDCGSVMTCPNCSIPLTYHSANGRLMCHYCGFNAESVQVCPKCGGSHLKYTGLGTQRLERTLNELFPDAKILRMDMDTTLSKFSHERILKKFSEEKYDILIGTQMVAKGLDFPNVTLAGVISADQSLYMSDFRASERTFSLLTQVVGRAGRGDLKGRAVIQTQTPENAVIKLAKDQDYESFYGNEIKLRKTLLYPPFCDVCEIGFTGLSEDSVAFCARRFADMVKKAAMNTRNIPLRLLGPSPASVLKVSNRYRYKVVLKCRNDRKFRALLSGLLISFAKEKCSGKVTVFADMNPLTTI